MDYRTLRRAARGVVPARARPLVRRLAVEAPHRIKDSLPDLTNRLVGLWPLPPAELRVRVGGTSSRAEFVSVGKAVWRDLRIAIEATGTPVGDLRDWLDFGCGAGRVARHALETFGGAARLTGVDVDQEAIAWCKQHLLGRYDVIRPDPPTSIADASFDLVYSVSVFSHLSEDRQRVWLAELSRLLRTGGLLVASTHSPALTWSRPDLTPLQHRELTETGFLFAPSGRSFSDDSAFHSEQYLHRVWGSLFELRFFKTHGLGGYQDLGVWRKP